VDKGCDDTGDKEESNEESLVGPETYDDVFGDEASKQAGDEFFVGPRELEFGSEAKDQAPLSVVGKVIMYGIASLKNCHHDARMIEDAPSVLQAWVDCGKGTLKYLIDAGGVSTVVNAMTNHARSLTSSKSAIPLWLTSVLRANANIMTKPFLFIK